ncbi:Uncharacterized protein C15orf43, partial [Lonchura striata]
MFRGHRAWFSQSVSPGPRGLWGEGARRQRSHPEVGTPWMPSSPHSLSPAADGGGTITHWLDADYLFSSDAAHPDTRSIHESLSYLEGRATVFHSCYLSACVSIGAGERPSVALGHFVLPPACLHEEIRRKIGRFIWEKADALEEQDKQPPELVDRHEEQNGPPEIQEEAVTDLLCHLDANKSMGLDGIYPRVTRELEEELAKLLSMLYNLNEWTESTIVRYTGDTQLSGSVVLLEARKALLRDRLDQWTGVICMRVDNAKPEENPTQESETARNSCEEESEEEVLDLAESSEETDSEAPAQGEFPYRALQEYPINNMVTGYASAQDMKKYEGELHDFIPGTSGYAVYWVQSKFSTSCEKTKMKRK